MTRSLPALRPARLLALALPLGVLPLLSACSSTGGGGSVLDAVMFGPTGAPAIAAAPPPIEVVDCPPVTVMDGGAAIRSVTGSDDAGVRNQISIVNVARECTGRPDGGMTIKVGVQGRVLLGPGGSPGRFEAPVTFLVKRGDQVLGQRVARTAVVIPPDQAEQTFAVVEDGFVVPAGVGEVDVEVGLGASGARAARGRRG